jgi:hypothetical protein
MLQLIEIVSVMKIIIINLTTQIVFMNNVKYRENVRFTEQQACS